ncbi:hypothetical protein ACFWUW_02760 [Streptomyces sp. NPDC058655]|uniref:LppU/SCO3897 family protein n=1 Tax=unclassified Streptomyces TaxID=2593676 RepID=UPI003665C4E6
MATPPPPQQGTGPRPGLRPDRTPPSPQGPYVRHTAPYARDTGPYAPYGPYAPRQDHRAPAAGGAEQGAYGCRVCGSLPVADTTVYGHQGVVVVMRFLSRKGPFCRDCGLATVREMSARTLWQGWWGPLSLFVTPVTLLTNLAPWGRLRRLGPPTGGVLAPLDPGRPLWRRPAAVAVLVPLLLAALAVPVLVLTAVVGGGDPDPLSVGQCVRNKGDWSDQDLQVTECGSVSAEFEVTRMLDAPGAACAAGEYIGDLAYGPDRRTASCLRPLR